MASNDERMPASVGRVDEQFRQWRAVKHKGDRIPRRLRKAAAALCEGYSVHKVSRWLRLNHTNLQDWASKRHRSGRSPSSPAFVECSLPEGILAAGLAEYVVEAKGGMSRIHVRGASALEVAALVNALKVRGSGA